MVRKKVKTCNSVKLTTSQSKSYVLVIALAGILFFFITNLLVGDILKCSSFPLLCLFKRQFRLR